MGRKDRKPAPKPSGRSQPAPEDKRAAADYYRLNTRAVDDLVNATPENSPKVSETELRKYRSGPKIHLKDWVKAVLIKWWFAGAVCFFFYWGLGTMVPSAENLLLILGVGLGMVTNLLTNNVLRFWAKVPGGNDRWMMVNRRGAPGLLLDVLYGFLVLGCVVASYQGINRLLIALSGAEKDAVPLGVEPIVFGLLVTGWDFLFLGIRRTFRKMLIDAREKNAGRRPSKARSGSRGGAPDN